jgi:hypothetical protein
MFRTTVLCALLWLFLGCEPATEPSRQSHEVWEDRDERAIGVDLGPGVDDESPSCGLWRLFAATSDEIAAFRHPQGDPLAAIPGSVRALSAGPGRSLLTASEAGVVVLPEHGAPFLLLDHPATAVAYDAHLDRLYAALEGGVVAAVDDPLGAAAVGRFVTFADAAALAVGVQGHLFVAENDVVLRLASGEPSATLSSPAWGAIEGLAIGVDGSLYLVDGGDTVFVIDDPELASGATDPTKRITVEAGRVALRAVLIAPDGVGYVADHDAVHAIEELSDAYPFAAPSSTWGNLAAPRALGLLPPCPVGAR